MRTFLTSLILVGVLSILPGFALSQGDDEAVRNPHKRIERSCETCHVPISFHEIQFDHNTTNFPLFGRHSKTACLLCHSVEDFSQVETACFSCHEDIHLGQLDVECERCHTSQAWNIFDAEQIHARTNFPLIGRHLLVDCQSCHGGQMLSSYSMTSSRCVECHQSDYLSTVQPNHVSNGLSTQCEECHQMSAWKPAMMPDHDPFFPIFSGTHRGTWSDCTACHVEPGNPRVFSCLTCHEHAQPEMDGDHQGIAGYAYVSSECYICHPTGEKGRFVDHDPLFPIFSGKHLNTWDTCANCHTSPSNRSVFDCLGCHDHARTPMDDKHSGMTGYAYVSSECFACHPTGEKGNFLEHEPLFPIYSGAHINTWDDCLTCHTVPSNRKQYDCLVCHEHAQPEMDGVHGGMTGYAYVSSECFLCHPTGEKGEFLDHDPQFFPIFSGAHRNEWDTCATCHTNPTNRSVFTCIDCHDHNRTDMDDKHSGEQDYTYTSAACYDCHPDGRSE